MLRPSRLVVQLISRFAIFVAMTAAFVALSVAGAARAETASGAAPVFHVTGVARHDTLNVRKGPSHRHPLVGRLAYDAKDVRIVGRCVQNWCLIYRDGVAGFVNRTFLARDPVVAGFIARADRIIPPAPVPARRVSYAVTGVAPHDVLMVRADASISAPVRFTLAPNMTCVEMAGACKGAWCPVRMPSRAGTAHGWVDSRHLAPSNTVCR